MKSDNLDNLIRRIFNKDNFTFPSSIMFEITQRCNLRCKFCYLGKYLNAETDMPKGKLFEIVNQLDEVGCIEVVLTGGEPLIREDFLEIYRYIKTKGILVIVFTNGTMITKEIVKGWRDSPPHWVKIALYAGTPEGYERISGNKKAYEQVVRGATLLKEANIGYSFRFVLTKNTVHEVEQMKELASRFGVSFSIGTSLTPDTDGNKFPVSLKISKSKRENLKRKAEFREKLLAEDKRISGENCSGYFTITNQGKLTFCPVIKDEYDIDLNQIHLGKALEKMVKRKLLLKCPGL